MKYEKFTEYLNRNHKLVSNPPVEQVPDFEGKSDVKPVKENKHKDAGGKGQDGEIKPYKGGTDAKDPNKGKLKDGFANTGDKKLKYEPGDNSFGKKKVSKSEEGVPGGEKKATWPKTKTQEWIDRTKNLSLAEFTKEVRAETLDGLNECACQEAPHNSIKEAISACKCNQKYISAVVREMKRNGLFGKLMKEMVQHPETFKALAILMEKDESYARKLANAMNEMVAPPIGEHPMHKKKALPPHIEDDEMGDEHDDLDGLGNDDKMGDDHDEDDMGDEHDDLDGLENDDMGDKHDMDAIPSSNGPPIKKKPKHNNLLNAMKGHPALMGQM